ncbi:MAG: EFR1 family ferrodoxin [Spirochaetales bacterium]|nr:EFR1 family ferrodoxin [Spirochaetales bacterium]
MKKIGIIYHSGSGSTRLLCEVLRERLSPDFEVELHSVGTYDGASLMRFDCIVIAFPTYHCRPSESIMEFVDALPPARIAKRAVVLTTYGLYPGNSVRILAEKLREKQIVTVHHLAVRGPASDGALMLPPWISFMFRYERSVAAKIDDTIGAVGSIVKAEPVRTEIPAYKWYVPFTALPQFFGKRTYMKLKERMSIDGERCTNCGVCIRACDRACWTHAGTGENGEYTPVPIFRPERCEFCLRCIHGCPMRAIGFAAGMKNAPRLDTTFYGDMKRRLAG